MKTEIFGLLIGNLPWKGVKSQRLECAAELGNVRTKVRATVGL